MQDQSLFQGLLGAPITLNDSGFYIAHNRADGSVNSILHLSYHQDNWWLYQLKHQAASQDAEEALFWLNLGAGEPESAENALQSMHTADLQQWLQRPELQEMPGGWQVLHNTRFGFGKFSPADNATARYALLRFRDGQMLGPILIEKTHDPEIIALWELAF